MNDFGIILKDLQVWIVGLAGSLIHIGLRRDVPMWQHLIMVIVALPVSVLLIGPSIAEHYELTHTAEKTVVFVLAMFGRDVLVGFNKLSGTFSKDPMAILTFWKKK